MLLPIDTKLVVWIAYIKTQRGIAAQVYVIKVNFTVTKNKIQFRLNNFSLLLPIGTKLGACNQCNQINGIIFSSLPSFISYSCHINTLLNRWKPAFVALRCSCFILNWLCFKPKIEHFWWFNTNNTIYIGKVSIKSNYLKRWYVLYLLVK